MSIIQFYFYCYLNIKAIFYQKIGVPVPFFLFWKESRSSTVQFYTYYYYTSKQTVKMVEGIVHVTVRSFEDWTK